MKLFRLPAALLVLLLASASASASSDDDDSAAPAEPGPRVGLLVPWEGVVPAASWIWASVPATAVDGDEIAEDYVPLLRAADLAPLGLELRLAWRTEQRVLLAYEPDRPFAEGEHYLVRLPAETNIWTNLEVGPALEAGAPSPRVAWVAQHSGAAERTDDIIRVGVGDSGFVNVLSLEGAAPAADSLLGVVSSISTRDELVAEPRTEPGDPAAVQVAAFDLTGRFSGWSAPLHRTWPPAGCTSCSASASSKGSRVLWLMLVGVATLSRRRL